MRLVTLNAWGGNILEPLLDYLEADKPEIILLQEVTSAVDPSPERLFFKGHGWDLPQAADLYAMIAKMLPDHQAMFAPAMQGELFDDDDRAYRSRFGLASFVHRDFAILGQAQDFVHGVYRPNGWGEPPVPRNMQALRLFDPESEHAFTVGHLHGLRDLAGKHDTPARAEQARRVLDIIAGLRRPGEAAIFGGDLNLLPESESFPIWRDAGFTELVTTRGITDTRTHLYEKPQRFADYLLVSPEVTVSTFDAPSEPVISDHRPLVLDFSV